MTAPITTAYAIPLAVILLALSIRVIIARRTKKVAYGAGEDRDTEARIRAQANWAEYVPTILLLMALAELQGAGAVWLHLTGGVLLIGRLLHGYTMSFDRAFFHGRVWGTGLTFTALVLAILIAAGALLW